MKKKKRLVKSFKNWLLARDGSSRIGPLPPDHRFFEEKDLEEKNSKK
jgi:hypothetical protein